MPSDQQLRLVGEDGRARPMQQWTLASWPDGSCKWTGHAATLERDAGTTLRLAAAGDGPEPDGETVPVKVEETDDTIVVDTGPLRCEVARSGPQLLRQLATGGRTCSSGVRLVGETERRRVVPGGEQRIRVRAVGMVDAASVEHVGPERCVVRVEGRHLVQEAAGVASRLPWVVRIYLYRGLPRVRIVHTVVVDRESTAEYPAAIGLEASVALAGPAYNRHVLLGGEGDGVFLEPAQLLWTWRGRDADGLYERQIAGEAVELDSPAQAGVRELLRDQASWRSFKLVQDSAGHYAISKRTREGCAWVRAGDGQRASGVAAVSGERGGLAVAAADFWRKAPRSLEADHLLDDAGVLRCWFWSPDSEPMDLRHYDVEAHMQAAYEGFDEIRADATGVANTNELWLEPLAAGDPRPAAAGLAQLADRPPLLVCQPEWYHRSGTLGVWSLPGDDTAARRWVESQLTAAVDFYLAEIDRRGWYGFWDYGDVMHTYDPVRHTWRYDLGGFSWQNTELVPNLWLWYSFLRTGRADVFRMAAAMTRHTSEVDVYHAGPYEGLGSRHNVRHWGCSCKEARISMAGLHRAFYYLTADERVGEIMREVAGSVEGGLERLDPCRTLVPTGTARTHARTGPDWAALCSDWMVEWERTGDEAGRRAIETGLADLRDAPLHLLSGPVFGYDPDTKRLEHIGDDNYQQHMVVAFGGPETWMELCELLPESGLRQMLVGLGRFAALTDEERGAAGDGPVSRAHWGRSIFHARLVGFAAAVDKDDGLGARAWQLVLANGPGGNGGVKPQPVPAELTHRAVEEIPWVSTNTVSQWSLNAIECLQLAPRALEQAWPGRAAEEAG